MTILTNYDNSTRVSHGIDMFLQDLCFIEPSCQIQAKFCGWRNTMKHPATVE